MPQRSRSSNRSRGSRTRSRRGSGRAIQERNTKSLNRDGIDFFALLLGLVTSTVLLLLIGNVFWGPGVRTPVSELPPQEVGPRVAALDKQGFTEFVDAARADELELALVYLNELADSEEEASFDLHRRRHMLARQLTGTAPTGELLELAEWSLIDGLRRQHALDPKTATRNALADVARRFRNNSNARISRSARRALAELAVEDLDARPAEVAEQLHGLIEDAGEQSEGIRLLDRAIKLRHLSAAHAGQDEALINAFLRLERLSETPEQARLYDELADLLVLMEHDLLRDNWDRFEVEGPRAYPRLREKAVQLLASPDVGHLLGERLLEVAGWLEEKDEVGEALQIYQAIAENVSQYSQVAVANELLAAANRGQQRSRLLNQTLRLEGTLPGGQPLEASGFQDRVLLVVFFKFSEPDSVSSLENIDQQLSHLKGLPLKMLAVSIDKSQTLDDASQRYAALQEALPDWTLCVPAESGASPLLEQCPTQKVPRVLLTDRTHRVVGLNVDYRSVEWQVTTLINLLP